MATQKESAKRTSSTSGRKAPAPRPVRHSKSASAKPPKPEGNAGIRVRMYRVGFGDFFLITLSTKEGPKHILVDCGVHAGNIGSIDEAVKDMAQETNNELALIIVTHRHADHISGFATCKDAFSQFTVGRVWMSWFENPNEQKAVKFQATLVDVAQKLRVALAARADEESTQFLAMAGNITGTFDASGRASNDVALQVLHGGFKNKPPVEYYQAGDKPKLPDELSKAGLTADILGPPIDPALIAQMDSKNHQYLASDDPEPGSRVALFDPAFQVESTSYPAEAFAPVLASDIERLVDGSQPDLAAAKAKQADNTLNNQSLVVLFGYNGKTMLFVGDAQWGNWQNFLFGGAAGAATKIADRSAGILQRVDFYKVGHHGSTNATPIDALNALRNGCVAMCSTETGCYGSEARDSEVPRIPLLNALEQKTGHQLARSDQVSAGGKPPTPHLGPLADIFKSPPAGLYIDYNF